MKKIILISTLALGAIEVKAQSTIPTTTVNGSLRITDSLQVTNDIRSTGDISISGNMNAAAVVASGEVTATDTMRAKKDVLVDGNAVIGGDLTIGGQATFRDNVFLNKSIMFNNSNEFSYRPATTGNKASFYLGNSNYKTLPYIACPNPNANTLPQFLNNGSFISFVPTGSGAGSTNASLSMYTAPWDGSGIIEVGGTDNNGLDRNGLLLNYFCHRNTFINTGWDIPNGVDGGTVFMGAKIDMQRSLRIGYSANPIIDLSTNIELNQNGTNNNGVKLNTYSNDVKFLTINNSNLTNSPFIVYGNGKTHIGIGRPKTTGVASNAMLSVDGLILAKEVRVAVSTATHWADDVFEKNYTLKTLAQVEQYINKYKHLPDVPSAQEVVEDGFDVNQISATLLRKIEELTLYTIELKKQMELQQKEINALKNK